MCFVFIFLRSCCCCLQFLFGWIKDFILISEKVNFFCVIEPLMLIARRRSNFYVRCARLSKRLNVPDLMRRRSPACECVCSKQRHVFIYSSFVVLE